MRSEQHMMDLKAMLSLKGSHHVNLQSGGFKGGFGSGENVSRCFQKKGVLWGQCDFAQRAWGHRLDGAQYLGWR